MNKLVVKLSEKGYFYTDYKGFRIVVKQTKKGYYKGNLFKGENKCKLISTSNLKLMFTMAVDHIDENY